MSGAGPAETAVSRREVDLDPIVGALPSRDWVGFVSRSKTAPEGLLRLVVAVAVLVLVVVVALVATDRVGLDLASFASRDLVGWLSLEKTLVEVDAVPSLWDTEGFFDALVVSAFLVAASLENEVREDELVGEANERF